MYAEVDFLLAMAKPDDWLAERAETIHEEHEAELWTSEHALVELMLVAYREETDVERVVANAKQLVEVRGDADAVLAAASHVEENGFTPFDALHLVRSGEDPIVSSDGAYDELSERVPLEPVD
jgi:hypothetical protein